MKKIILWFLLFFFSTLFLPSYADDIDISNSIFSQNLPLDIATNWNFLSSDWLKYFNLSNAWIREYSLSTANDLTSFSLVDSVDLCPVFLRWLTFSSDWTNLYYTCNWADETYQRTLSVWFDLSTLSSVLNSFSHDIYDNNVQDLYITIDWTKLFLIWNEHKNIIRFDLSIPFDLSSYIYHSTSSQDFWFTVAAWIHFSPDWMILFVSNYSIVYQYSLLNPFDITWILTQFSSFTHWYNASGLFLSSDLSLLFSPLKTYITDWIVSPPWPSPLEITSTWTIINLSNWIELNWLETNEDFSLSYEILKYDGPWYNVVDSGDLWTFSGGVNDVQFLNNEDFSFIQLGTYDLWIFLTDLNDENNIITKYYNADYNYNSWYIPPEDFDYNFFTSWYFPFENGFSLDNFTANPSWWNLYFEIIAPAITWTWTIDITTEKYWPIESDWNWYGFDTKVKVTYPYHQTAWIYQVRALYEYDELIIYPFWTDYNSYEITLSESPANYEFEELYICDTDENWVTEIWESLACPFVIIKYYSIKITDNINKLKEFFIKIMTIWTDEVKTFSFIQTTNAANFMDWLPNIADQDNVVSKLYFFVKWFLYLVFILLGVGLIIFLKMK